MTRLDRLGRSLRDIANIAHEIESAQASLRVLEQAVDTSTSAGKAFFGMLAVFAQFETDVRLRRLRYPGATARIDRATVQMLKMEGLGPTEIAARLSISRMSVYRILKGGTAQHV